MALAVIMTANSYKFGRRRIYDSQELEKLRNFHIWQHAYFAVKRLGMSPSWGIAGVVLSVMLRGIGYSPYLPVPDGSRYCIHCMELGLSQNNERE